jgi:hypothetical protein
MKKPRRVSSHCVLTRQDENPSDINLGPEANCSENELKNRKYQ